MHELRFRQVHLDFHTSPAIPEIGAAFDKAQWQAALRAGHVNSITCFAVGHHGWNYNDTRIGKRHPHLDFDLLRAQFDACKEIDVNVPIYITAGVSSRVGEEHPEWREISPEGGHGWGAGPLKPGFKTLCFNSPYTAYLCELIVETVRQFPDCNGIFLDIISQGQCCCEYCLASMRELGLDPENEDDRLDMSRRSLEKYYRLSTAAVRCDNRDMPVFHNSGHITRGRRDILPYFSHLELESLPTGGWGYDHFPVSAKYCKNLDLDVLGMTGKFHTTWGEFGGYKHPNALRYECAAMLAYGAKCSIGDQLHPSGRMDESTYRIIGAAFDEVEHKEAWCRDTCNVADVALLSGEQSVAGVDRERPADDGAARLLLEGQFLFDVIDPAMPFSPYRMLVLPDALVVDEVLEAKLRDFLAEGGKLFLSGTSGIRPEGGFLFDVGAVHDGVSPFAPDFVEAAPDVAPAFVADPFVMYSASQRIRVTTGRSLGRIFDPYFNRTYAHYCSHQHTPPRPEASGFDCGVRNGPVLYLAHPVFTLYRASGAVALKDYVVNALRLHLGGASSLCTNLPSTARVSLMRQEQERRYVLHLLHANTISRGGKLRLSGGTVSSDGFSLEVIEELLPLHDTTVRVSTPEAVQTVTLEPQGTTLPFEQDGKATALRIASFSCHQMVVLHY